jgi:hypothetical protein
MLELCIGCEQAWGPDAGSQLKVIYELKFKDGIQEQATSASAAQAEVVAA